MSLCQSGQIPCGDQGCSPPDECCLPQLDYACATGATCFTNTGSVGCWWKTSEIPSGTRPCYDYAATNGGCGTDNWCIVCSKTDYPYCYTNYILGGQVPLTLVSCGSITGTHTVVTAGVTHSGTPTVPINSPTSYPFSNITPTPTSITIYPPNPPTSTPSPQIRGLSNGAIAGIAIGAFFAIAIIGLLAFFLWRKQQNAPPAPAALPPPAPLIPVQSPGYPGYPAYSQQGSQQGYGGGGDQALYGYGQQAPKEHPMYEVEA